MGLGDLVVRGRQPVVLHRAHGGEQRLLQQLLADLEGDRTVGDQTGKPAELLGLVERLALDVLGDDPGAASGGEVGLRGRVGRVDGQVHRAVAHPQDDHALVAELLRVLVVVRVHLAPRELAGEGRLGPARVPVVAVGDHHGVIDVRLAVLELDLEHAVVPARDMRDAGLEADPVAEAEVVDVVVEVLGDLSVVREVGKGLRHLEVRVLHALARRVDVQRAIGGRHPVAVAEDPVAADPVGLLVAVEGDPALVKGLGAGDPRRAGADDAGLRAVGLGS